MCSIDDGESILEVNTFKRVTESVKCMKCRTSTAITIIRIHDPMYCFIRYATHKFRSSFGKSRLVRDGQRVVVAFSGGQASCSMLHLITEGLSKRAQKKLRFIPILLFINDTALLKPKEAAVAVDSVRSIRENMEASGLECYTYELCQVYQPHLSTTATDADIKDYRTHMERAFNDCRTLTAKEHLLSILRETLLIAVTRLLNVEMLFIGDSLTRLAERTLVSMVIGNGANVGPATAFSDTKHGDVMIIRPLRMFSSKEIAIYNQMNGVTSIFIPTISTMSSVHKSINKLSEHFVSILAKNSATVISTICRTAEKLTSDVNTANDSCELCQYIIDTEDDLTTARAHTSFLVSTLLSSSAKLDIEGVLRGGPGGGVTTAAEEGAESRARVCYSCAVFLRELNSKQYLPIQKRTIVSSKEIEEELSEFILKD